MYLWNGEGGGKPSCTLNFLTARNKTTKGKSVNFPKHHAEVLVFFVSLNKFLLIFLYKQFNVNKANEKHLLCLWNLPLRITKGTISSATAAYLMAPSVTSTKSLSFELWLFYDCKAVYFKRWFEFHRIIVNEWLKHR